MRPNIGSKGKLRQQFNLHFSHTGCFFYRRMSTVDGAALPFAIQQLCRSLLGEKPDLKETVYMTVIPRANTFTRNSKRKCLEVKQLQKDL